MSLKKYIEEILDDFQSTFVAVDENKLQNMMGFKGDFETLENIVQKYIPDAKLKFTKCGFFEENYDMYVIELEEK